MKIEVFKITPNEHMAIQTSVLIKDYANAPHNDATLTIFIEQKDYTLSELKAEAIRKAKEFLRRVLDEA